MLPGSPVAGAPKGSRCGRPVEEELGAVADAEAEVRGVAEDESGVDEGVGAVTGAAEEIGAVPEDGTSADEETESVAGTEEEEPRDSAAKEPRARTRRGRRAAARRR